VRCSTITDISITVEGELAFKRVDLVTGESFDLQLAQSQYAVSVNHDPRTLHVEMHCITDYQERRLCYE